MKKALTRIMLSALVIVTLLTIVPLSASASTSNNKTKIFSYLTQELGFNSAAACGIMANIEKESRFKPGSVIRDSNGLTSGGLCMWNGTRFSNLKSYCNKNGYDYLSIEGQLSYLEYELQKSSYRHIYNSLKKVSNTSSGAYNAAHYWCYYFEIPSNRATKAKQRGNSAVRNYWPVYGKKTLTKPTVTLSGKSKSFDLANSITFKWTSSGKNATDYKLYVARMDEKTKKYDWSNAKIYFHSASSRSRKISLSSYQTGSYSAYISAIHSPTGTKSNSKAVTFSVKCLKHTYETYIAKEPTFTAKGQKIHTCTKCALQKKEALPVLTSSAFKSTKMYQPFVTSTTRNKVRLEWQPMTGVTGYMIYVRQGKEWKLIDTIKSSDYPKYVADGLKPGTDYRFAVKSYVVVNKKKYTSAISPSVATATKTVTPQITKLTAGAKKATLSWNKVSGADGYIVYMSTKKDSGFKKLVSVDAKTATYTASKLTSNKTYYFQIKSFKNTAEQKIISYASEVKSVKIK